MRTELGGWRIGLGDGSWMTHEAGIGHCIDQVRILHVLKTDGLTGGVQRHLLTLLPGLAARGVNVRLLIAATGRAQDVTDAMEATGIDVRQTAAGPDLNPYLYWWIRNEIREFGPDLVHTHLIHADFHGQPAAARLGVPAVSSLHSAHGFYRRWPYRRAFRHVSRKATRTIAISEY